MEVDLKMNRGRLTVQLFEKISLLANAASSMNIDSRAAELVASLEDLAAYTISIA